MRVLCSHCSVLSLQALKYLLFCFPPTNFTAPYFRPLPPCRPLSSSSTKTRRRENTLPYIDYIIQHVPSALIDSTLSFHSSTIYTLLHSTTLHHSAPEDGSLHPSRVPFSPIILPNSTPLQTTRSRAFPPAGTATSASSWLPHVYLDYCSAPQYPSLPYRPGLYYLPPCRPRTVCTS